MTVFEGAVLLMWTGAAAGVWWIGKSLAHLKSMTDSMKNVFESMKASAEYAEKVQKIGHELYDPELMRHAVSLRVESAVAEHRKKTDARVQGALDKATTAITSTVVELLEGFYGFTFLATRYLDKASIAMLMEKLKGTLGEPAFKDLSSQMAVWEARSLGSRQTAVREALEEARTNAQGNSE